MHEHPGNPGSRSSMLRSILITSILIIITAFIYLVAITVFNDAPLSPEVKSWIADEKPLCGEDDNAYYFIAGISARKGIDPYLAGKERVAKCRKDMEDYYNGPGELKFDEQKESDMLQLGETVKNICDPLKEDCNGTYLKTDYAKKMPAGSYDTAMERYEKMYGYGCYQTTLKPDMIAPFASFASSRQMQCLKLATIADKYANGRRDEAVAELNRDMKFYRQMLTQADTLIAKMVFLSLLKRDIIFYSQLLDSGGGLPESLNRVGEGILPLNKKERSLRKAFSYEFRAQSNTIVLSALKGPSESRKEDYISEMFDNLGIREKKMYTIIFFKKNATITSSYKSYECIAKLCDMDAADFLSSRDVSCQGAVGYYSYAHNPIGSILVNIATPVYPEYVARFHDANGLIRLVQLKRLIRLNRVPSDRIEQFLKDNAKEYGDPYTGAPMKWDAKRKVISFKPGYEKSKPADYEISIS